MPKNKKINKMKQTKELLCFNGTSTFADYLIPKSSL